MCVAFVLLLILYIRRIIILLHLYSTCLIDICNRPDAFQCFDGLCIPWDARCDGIKDCSGCSGEDEQGCIMSILDVCTGMTN